MLRIGAVCKRKVVKSCLRVRRAAIIIIFGVKSIFICVQFAQWGGA